eukprot:TRINITY_DN11498_c0_g1_i2.p1 TRINITY_DN11498_c0_g1~~TRINITY_DN11498_c0_g1_i2.p1  ORF type:complete len:271 (-),score=35.12 TRINITY_DN11498_c0_g1_i2:320-1132(-)
MGNCERVCCKKEEPLKDKQKENEDGHQSEIDEAFYQQEENIEKIKIIQARVRGEHTRKLLQRRQTKDSSRGRHSENKSAVTVEFTTPQPTPKSSPEISAAEKSIRSTVGNFSRVFLPRLMLAEGVSFTGHWKNGKRDGFGLQVWADGARYEGDWLDDMEQGKGKLSFPNGDCYEGDFLRGKPDGFGIFTANDGGVYEGDWRENQKHGKGRETWPEGNQYEGDYYRGHMHGKGQMIFKDGRIWNVCMARWQEVRRRLERWQDAWQRKAFMA